LVEEGNPADTERFMPMLDRHIQYYGEAYGIELDYSCRSGSCGECEVKCKGLVEMSEDCEIDDKTQAAGFVYSCCCVAKSDLELEM
jgi:ferredoxin